jgi:hypothetical protein
MERQLQEFDSRLELDPPADPPRQRIIRGNQLRFASLELSTELYRILGVDLTRVPGLDTLTDYTLFSEVGSYLSRFPSASHFARLREPHSECPWQAAWGHQGKGGSPDAASQPGTGRGQDHGR